MNPTRNLSLPTPFVLTRYGQHTTKLISTKGICRRTQNKLEPGSKFQNHTKSSPDFPLIKPQHHLREWVWVSLGSCVSCPHFHGRYLVLPTSPRSGAQHPAKGPGKWLKQGPPGRGHHRAGKVLSRGEGAPCILVPQLCLCPPHIYSSTPVKHIGHRVCTLEALRSRQGQGWQQVCTVKPARANTA